ncbi:MAG: deoxyribose-phosphate aldolase [Parachlamydiales bacterium]|nr:deoxyribose-phosphate aldolase [Parachlamydiales bacterium]
MSLHPSLIDQTLLKPDADENEIKDMCIGAIVHKFATVCINPSWVRLASHLLKEHVTKIGTVVGFPLGASTTAIKVAETKDAIANGAQEIDMVINIGQLKSKKYEYVLDDIRQVVEAASDNIVKVILETALLTKDEKTEACLICLESGAHFVKTSTGFSKHGATLDDIELLHSLVKGKMGVKASGGIRDRNTALSMIKAGASRIGTSNGVALLKD